MTCHARLVVTPLAFGLAATASRWFFPTTETRYHILAFWLLAGMMEFGANRIGLHPSPRRFCLNAAAAAVAGASVKWYTEGILHQILA